MTEYDLAWSMIRLMRSDHPEEFATPASYSFFLEKIFEAMRLEQSERSAYEDGIPSLSSVTQ